MSLGLAYLHLFFEILFRFMQIYFIKPNYLTQIFEFEFNRTP